MGFPLVTITLINNDFIDREMNKLTGNGTKVFISICKILSQKEASIKNPEDRNITTKELLEITGIHRQELKRAIINLMDHNMICCCSKYMTGLKNNSRNIKTFYSTKYHMYNCGLKGGCR